jgi:hypothetical protein
MSDGLYVNGIEVVFCDRCENGYEGKAGSPLDGLWVTIESWPDGAIDIDEPLTMTLCAYCAEETKEFFKLD